jgi:hypothetical protein
MVLREFQRSRGSCAGRRQRSNTYLQDACLLFHKTARTFPKLVVHSFFFKVPLGFEFRASNFVRQVLYHLSHSTSPFSS